MTILSKQQLSDYIARCERLGLTDHDNYRAACDELRRREEVRP